MASLNRVYLAGNVTRDPEGRRTPNGTAVCDIGLAVNRRYRNNSGELVEDTTFVDVEVWGQQADFCRDFLRKGAPVLIEGRLRLDQWEDRTTGQKRSRLKVVAERVQALGGRGGDSESGSYSQGGGGYSQGGNAYDGGQEQSYGAPQGRPQQQQRPAPPPFPSDGGQNVQPGPNGGDAFDVDDESIDDIPF